MSPDSLHNENSSSSFAPSVLVERAKHTPSFPIRRILTESLANPNHSHKEKQLERKVESFSQM